MLWHCLTSSASLLKLLGAQAVVEILTQMNSCRMQLFFAPKPWPKGVPFCVIIRSASRFPGLENIFLQYKQITEIIILKPTLLKADKVPSPHNLQSYKKLWNEKDQYSFWGPVTKKVLRWVLLVLSKQTFFKYLEKIELLPEKLKPKSELIWFEIRSLTLKQF